MSNHENKPFSQAVAKRTESIFDKSAPLTCNLTCKNLCSSEVTKGVYALHKNFLVFFGADQSNSPTSVLDFSHAKLGPLIYLSKFKITLSKDKFCYEFLFPDKKVWELWIAHFQQYCIFTNFHEKYDVLEASQDCNNSQTLIVRSYSTGCYYSAKAFDKEELLDPEDSISQISLINQIETMRRLDYKKILKLIEIHETYDFIYLITELAPLQTLENMLKSSKLSRGATKIIIFSILKGLAYMASKGIIHRNIKPSNILLDDKRTEKITGFNLATFVNAPKINFGTCGTPGYIAPEILTSQEEKTPCDDKCDVFSAGCIFFNLLFGYPLFQGNDVSEIMASNKRIIDCNIEEIIPKENDLDISKPEIQLLLKLLERDPSKRISARKALAHSYFHNSPVKTPIKLTSRDLTTTLEEPSVNFQPRKSSFSSYRSGDSRSPSPSERDQQSPISSLSFTSPRKISAPEDRRFSQLSPSSRGNQVLKAAIFCNLKNQLKNESAEEIKPSFVAVHLKKKSLSESKLLVSIKLHSQKPSVEEESEIVCDEGSNVCAEFGKWSGNFVENSPSSKMKRI